MDTPIARGSEVGYSQVFTFIYPSARGRLL